MTTVLDELVFGPRRECRVYEKTDGDQESTKPGINNEAWILVYMIRIAG